MRECPIPQIQEQQVLWVQRVCPQPWPLPALLVSQPTLRQQKPLPPLQQELLPVLPELQPSPAVLLWLPLPQVWPLAPS